MTISRRDTILIAVLVNAGVLAILLLATRYGQDENPSSQTPSEAVSEAQPISLDTLSTDVIGLGTSTSSEGQSLGEQSYLSNSSVAGGTPEGAITLEPSSNNLQQPVDSISTPPSASTETKSFVEVTVKKGDFLEKIARANGTTIEEIKKLNNLANDRLDVGQTLKIPLAQGAKAPATTSTATKKKNDPSKEISSKDAVYYTVKTGDNPWKIARQYNVRYEDILRLNGLNEEKARNLKVGDRIRVK